MNCERLNVQNWVVIASNGFRAFRVAPVEKVTRGTIRVAGGTFDKFNGRMHGASDTVICALATQLDIDKTLKLQFSKARGLSRHHLVRGTTSS